MFVIKEEDIQNKQCFCILIPDDLLQLYIKRWLDDLTKTSWVEDVIEENSLFINVTFRKAIRHYISQFTTENIASIIKTAPTYCLNLMFVMSVEDINENSEKRYECFGIVIPDDLLQQYIERWFKSLTKTWSVEYVMCDSRLLKNIMFRNSLCNYIRQLDTEKIAALILNADEDFINTMFVMAEQDIKDNDENRHECFGIVIPDNLLQQYMERWFQRLTKTSDLEKFINKNRPINNVTFCIALNEYVRQFNTEK
ncbi:unnamed protein product [Mytilus edulis]|uniref:Uncharacterized protein n=1 Tax=Mytilus edulis TaxID=6550 RepID=A0A8S3RHA8_MYTED|nr:unnamed protein product [Mytilus edulis]